MIGKRVCVATSPDGGQSALKALPETGWYRHSALRRRGFSEQFAFMQLQGPGVAILGAGAIGCHIGGLLAAAGARPLLIARQAIAERIASGGLSVSALGGSRLRLPDNSLAVTDNPQDLSQAHIILVTVKSGDTETAAGLVARHGMPGSTIVSLQNGIGNTEVLDRMLPGFTVVPGMVSFNVVELEGNCFHRSTDGEIVLGSSNHSIELVRLLQKAGASARVAGEMEAVQWSKLALNLNNAINVISGLPLRQQLLDRNYRRVLAAAIDEALAVMRARGIAAVRIGKVDPRIAPSVLRLPTPLFRILAAGMLRIGEDARSSMWDDLARGRKSEIDYLNGAVVMEGKKMGLATPVNERLLAIVHRAFETGRSPEIPGNELVLTVSA